VKTVDVKLDVIGDLAPGKVYAVKLPDNVASEERRDAVAEALGELNERTGCTFVAFVGDVDIHELGPESIRALAALGTFPIRAG
jgi:hypothetical protein